MKPYLLLALLWIVSRIPLVMHAEVWPQWETWQARKLLEHGFMARGGALTATPFMEGRLPYLSDLNYTNHPYPMVWAYTALYQLGGAGACLAFMLSLRLAGVLVCFALLRHFFSPRSAGLAMMFFVLAPAMLGMDTETNIIGIAAALWPFSALLAVKVGKGEVRARWLALLVLIGGQVDWFFLTLVPALAWLAAPPTANWRRCFSEWRCWPGTCAVFIGAALAASLFAAQFFIYVPDLGAAMDYLGNQMGRKPVEASKAKMLFVTAARNVLFVGPALCLGAFGSLRAWPVQPLSRRLAQACVVFISGFLLVEVVLVRFCVIEVSPYLYLVLPTTVLTAAALEHWRGKWLAAGLLGATIVAAAYSYVRESFPVVTEAARALAPAMAQHTQADEVVLTNLRANNSPFEPWDTRGTAMMALLADRVIWLNVSEREDAQNFARFVGRNFQRAVFAYSPDHPLSNELQDALRRRGEKISEETVSVPAQPQPLGAKMRLTIWKITGRYAQRGEVIGAAPPPVHLVFYRMREGWLADAP